MHGWHKFQGGEREDGGESGIWQQINIDFVTCGTLLCKERWSRYTLHWKTGFGGRPTPHMPLEWHGSAASVHIITCFSF